MGGLTDPRPLARVVMIVVVVWIAAELLLQAATTAVGDKTESSVANPLSVLAGLSALLFAGSTLLSTLVVGRWIWRVNSNAHALADGMSISPRWAVGWFFVPFANLIKPFEAMKQAWQVSHDPEDWPNVAVPASLRWWWGFWVVSNFRYDLSFERNGIELRSHSLGWLDLVATGAAVASGVALLRVVRALSAAQARAIAAQAFH